MTHFKEKTFWTDENRVRRGLTSLLLFCLAVGLAIYAIRSGKPIMMVGVIALPFVIGLVGRPDLILLGAFLASASGLSVPGMRLEMSQLFYLMATASGALLFISKGYRWTMRSERRWMLLFSLVIFMLMAVRGAGLRFLGGTTWGGGPYVLILAAVAFNFFYEKITLTSKQMRTLLLLMIPVVVGAVVVKRFGFMQGFEEASDTVVGVGDRVERIGWPGPLGRLLILFSYIWFQNDKVRRWGCWLLGFGLIGLSGFRGQLVGVLAVVLMFEFFRAQNKPAFIWKCLLIGLAGYSFVFLFAPFLPAGLQRSLSFLPGLHVRLDAHLVWDAGRSSLWRREIWAFCWERVPDYLFIGRGITFSVYDALANMTGLDIGGTNQWFMYTLHNYHSGPLYLLLDYGIPGFIAFAGVQISMLIAVLRWMFGRTHRSGTLLEAYTFLLGAGFMWGVFSFYVVFGDEQSLIGTFFAAGVLRVFYRSVEREDAELAAQAALLGGEGAGAPEIRGQRSEDGFRLVERYSSERCQRSEG